MGKKGRTWILLLLMGPALLVLSGAGAYSRGSGMAAPAAGDAIGLADGGFALHGDTSVPDQELLKLYGDKVPVEVMMDDLIKKIPGTPFPHKKHVDRGLAHCGNCHHKNPRDIKPCHECHNDKPEDPKAPNYLKAHHDLCIECHKAVKAAEGLSDADPPPDKKCYDCHVKKEGDSKGPGK